MHKITSIHLNGKAYQLEEEAYDALRAYLSEAERSLNDNPDKSEILSDLEQAIGEKCHGCLNPNKDVITRAEMEKIILEMGPVEAAGAEKEKDPQDEKREAPHTPKRLFLIREGAWIAGVCTGLAAYFDVDVTLVRAVFVILAFITGGAWILVYIALMFIIPYATTGEERAAAYGEPFNAQEIVNRAKESYRRVIDKSDLKNWRDELRKQKEEWRKAGQEWRHEWSKEAQGQASAYHYTYRPRRASPFLGFVSALLAVVWIAALFSLITQGAVFGWIIPAGIPLWVAIILLFILFHIVTGPLRMAAYNPYAYGYNAWMSIVDTLSIVFIIVAAWFAYTQYPQVQDFVNGIPEMVRQGVDSIKK